MKYRSMAQIRAANKAAGLNWFEKESMRFFRTKIEGGPYGGRYFVTSEVSPLGRRYSVRRADDSGKISTQGKFLAYKTKAQAVEEAKALGSKKGSMARGGYLTKAQVVSMFREEVMPSIRKRYERDGIPDYPARSEAWNDLTDSLAKDGMISSKQYDSWIGPPETVNPRYRRR